MPYRSHIHQFRHRKNDDNDAALLQRGALVPIPLHLWTDAQLSHLPGALGQRIRSDGRFARNVRGTFCPNKGWEDVKREVQQGEQFYHVWACDPGVKVFMTLILGCGCFIEIGGQPLYEQLRRLHERKASIAREEVRFPAWAGRLQRERLRVERAITARVDDMHISAAEFCAAFPVGLLPNLKLHKMVANKAGRVGLDSMTKRIAGSQVLHES